MVTKIRFNAALTTTDPHNHPVLIIGQVCHLNLLKYDDIKTKLAPRVNEETFTNAVACLHPSPTDKCSLYLDYAKVAALPKNCSRHNSSSRAHAITRLVKNNATGVDETVVIVCEKENVYASGCAVVRAFSLYSRKSNKATHAYTVNVEFIVFNSENVIQKSPLAQEEIACLEYSAYGIHLAARIVDTPCSEMNVDHFLKEIGQIGRELGIVPNIIRGEELKKKGLGGIWGVGKAAEVLPALAVLSYTPNGATETVAWVGKGIVYDTGGLSIKGKTAMPGMKRDCGGAAAILGAFYVAVKQGFHQNLHAVFCLAENAVGPASVRPDDILTLYSGKTVEVNNTDAEGRLVLSDGAVFAQKDLKANIILDMATLTGAQGIATGKYHGAILTNNEEWERKAVAAGKQSGDLLFPIPYCPELHFPEYSSAVADMKNSVADRSNALASCAGIFINAHLGFDFDGHWIHIDMASPVHCGERATGYGVALLWSLFGNAETVDGPPSKKVCMDI